MPVNYDLDANAGPSKPSRSPTSERTFTGVDCKDQPDDQLQQGKRERKDQTQGQRKRKAPFRASRSPDWEQEESCDTGTAIHRKGEGLPKITSLILDFCQLPQQQAESLEETRKRMQRGAKLLEHYSLQAEINESLRKAHRQEAEKHSDICDERDALRRAVRYFCRQVIPSNRSSRKLSVRKKQRVRKSNWLLRKNDRLLRKDDRLLRKNSQLVQENNQLVQENNQLVRGKNQLAQENNQLLREKNQLLEENIQLVREKNQQLEEHIQLSCTEEKLYGSKLGRDWCLQESQRKAQLMEKKVKDYESSALEKDEEIRQRGRCVEELKKKVQESTNHAQQLLEVNKRQQETNTSSIRMLGGMLGPLVELVWEMDARSREQDNYNYHDDEPIRTSDDGVCFEPLSPSYNEPMSSSDDAYRIRRPLSLTSSLGSQDFEGAFLQVPSQSECHDESLPRY